MPKTMEKDIVPKAADVYHIVDDVVQKTVKQSPKFSNSAITMAIVLPVLMAFALAIVLNNGPQVLCSTFPNVLFCMKMTDDQTSIHIDEQAVEHAQPSTLVNLEFFNRLDSPVNVFWKDYEGSEQFWFQMSPRSYTGNITSMNGHVWTFRLDNDQETLLFDELLDDNHCGRIHIAPAVHVEALRLHCQKNGRAIGLGYWPRAPVVRRLPVSKDAKVNDVRHFTTSQPHFLTYDGERLSQEPATLLREVIATSPVIEKIEEFLSEEEAQHMIILAETLGFQSEDPAMAGSAWLEHGQSPIVNRIVRRVFDLLEFDADLMETFQFAEKIQIQRYLPGQGYLPHYDALDMSSSSYGPHNRYATVTIQLTDITSGGRDIWPRANGDNEFVIADHCEREQTFGVISKQGTAIVSYNMLEDGSLDEAALRASCPVTETNEIKYQAMLYFWDPFVILRQQPHH